MWWVILAAAVLAIVVPVVLGLVWETAVERERARLGNYLILYRGKHGGLEIELPAELRVEEALALVNSAQTALVGWERPNAR